VVVRIFFDGGPPERQPQSPCRPHTRASHRGRKVSANRRGTILHKGVTYGTFAPDANGYQFPSRERVAEDFRLMADFGINTVRTARRRASIF
jgi:hypothetical protein